MVAVIFAAGDIGYGGEAGIATGIFGPAATYRAQVPDPPDLSRLSLVCKTLRSAALPSLYSRLVLRVPTVWSHLSAVENLISSVGEGFQHVRSLRIAPQPTQWVREELDNDELLETISDGINYPLITASISLNCLIRLILRRIPKGRLSSFVYV